MSGTAKPLTGKSLAFKLAVVILVKLVFLALLWQFLVHPQIKHIDSAQAGEQ